MRRVLLCLVTAIAAVALTGTAASASGDSWTTISWNVQRTGDNTAESTVGTNNASQLHQLWQFRTNGVIDTSPVYAHGIMVNGGSHDVVFAGSEHGFFYAVDAQTGTLLWKRYLGSVQTTCEDLPGKIFGITSAPVLDLAAGRVYVAGGNGKVYALDVATGTTEAGWPVPALANDKQQHVWSALTLFQGHLYAETASYCDLPPYHGHIVEIDVATHQPVAHFFPVGNDNGGAIWGWGGASIWPSTGDVFVTTGNDLNLPQNQQHAEAVVRLSSDLKVESSQKPKLVGEDVDFGSTPTLFQRTGCAPQLAVENKSGVLFIYRQGDIASGPIQRIQVADVKDDEFDGEPAWSSSTNDLYVGNSSDSSSGPYRHGMVALHEDQTCRFSLDWQTTVGPAASVVSVPIVANGVVYYGDGTGGRVFGFDARTGAKLWNSPGFGAPIFAAPILVDGTLFAGGWDHELHAFGLG